MRFFYSEHIQFVSAMALLMIHECIHQYVRLVSGIPYLILSYVLTRVQACHRDDEESIAEWNEEPAADAREYEALACEEVFDLDDDMNEVAKALSAADDIKHESEAGIINEKVSSPLVADVNAVQINEPDETTIETSTECLTLKQREIKEKAAKAKQGSKTKESSGVKPASHSVTSKETDVGTEVKPLADIQSVSENKGNNTSTVEESATPENFQASNKKKRIS